MMKYRVEVREVHIQGYIIEADNPEHAKDLISNGEGEIDELSFEYSHMEDPDTWTVQEIEGEEKQQ